MNNPLVWFLVIVALVAGLVFWLGRGVLGELSRQAGQHAQTYARAYAKGIALVAIAMFTAYDETFKQLSTDVAAVLPWWHWLALFLKPVTAGLAVFVAFMDNSVNNASAVRRQQIEEQAEAEPKK